MAGIVARTVGVAALALPLAAGAQDIEPRLFSNTPVGVNFLLAGYVYTRGGLSLDPSLPITDAQLQTSSAVLAYARAIDFFGLSSKVDVVLPYTWLSGSATYQGDTVDRVVTGFGDPAFRWSVNFYGAPALALPQFASYRQDLILGGSVRVTAPAGQYDSTRVVNIGTHRWSVKPEIGASKAVGAWIFEVAAAATFFTDNRDFYNGRKRAQDPIYAVEAHVIHDFDRGIWGSLDATYYWGGQAYVDDAARGGELGNSRYGATLALPVDRNNSIKVYASSGLSARTGADFKLVGLVWQYRWGGGL
jgi:hypothetical protein